MALACPQCEGVAETVRHEDIFRYGDGESAVNLPVILPVRICRACGIEFLDHEAERVQARGSMQALRGADAVGRFAR